MEIAKMTFTVTYRDKTGAKREEALEAASRAECVAVCRKRGISPLSIHEGTGRAASPRRSQSRPNGVQNNVDSDGSASRSYRVRWSVPVVLGILAFLGILGGGAWWWLAEYKVTVPPRAQEWKQINPKSPQLEKLSPMPDKASISATNKPQKVMVESNPQKIVRDPAHYRNAANIGKKRIVHDDGTVEYVGRQTLFKRPFENMLVGITNPNGPAASGIMRLRRRYSDAQIYEMLHEPINIDRTKPDWAIEKQIQVQQFKLDLLEYLEQGKTLDEAVAAIRMNSVTMHQEYADAKKQLRDMIKSNANERDIADFVAAKNEELAAKGIKKLVVPHFDESENITTDKGDEK